MKVAILKEKASGEFRVAATPDSVSELVKLGCNVTVQSGAGADCFFADEDYKSAGATIESTIAEVVKTADVVLKVQQPSASEVSNYKNNAIAVGFLQQADSGLAKKYLDKKLSVFAVESIPRISRAQSMDALSSQSNLAGYKAVIDAAAELTIAMPMMMTAAGTVKPAKVLVLGAGVAGLQAIATAKRLGAVVSAFDVRPEVKEQVESLGAKFIEVESLEEESGSGSGGYAKEMSEEYKKRQQTLIEETVQSQDIVICTALIPGRKAPLLITQEMLKGMSQGSVVVDLAAIAGGNCYGSVADEMVTRHGVKIIGYTNMPGRLARNASQLYAKNLVNFLKLLIDDKSKAIKINFEDEIIQGALLTYDGKVVNEAFKEFSSVESATSKPTEEKPESAEKKAETNDKPAKK